MTFRLFVSHSNPSLAKDLTESLERLGPPNLRVLVDAREIQTGDDWRQRICFMLCTCDAAAILLDENALRSNWVIAEAIYLSVRASYSAVSNHPFRLLPVSVLPDREFTELLNEVLGVHHSFRRRSWDVTDLRRLQFSAAADADHIARILLADLSSTVEGWTTHVAPPAERLAAQLKNILAKAADVSLLEHMADSLDRDSDWGSHSAAARAGLALIRQLMAGGELSKVRRDLDGLGYGLTEADTYYILKTLSPLRFDSGAAAQLRTSTPDGANKWAGIQTNEPRLTVPAYIKLAHLPSRPFPILHLTCPLGTVQSIREELAGVYRISNPEVRYRSDRQIELRLETLRAYVVTPALDEMTLIELQKLYPSLLFINHYTFLEHLMLPEGGSMISPALDPNDESEIWVDIENSYTGLSNVWP